ncbi:hypothetical protein [Nonomuraea fuscirosea]|uniref:hypothetical protein n=1 Tax=Nonomuraea fuscirosea TaxID=1291556 RepID=UPI0033D7B430
MNPHDARTALADINRLQDATRDEIVRRAYATPRVLGVALGLFLALAVIDLGRPWTFAGLALGFVLYAGVGVLYEYRASVQRRPTTRELTYHTAVLAVMMVVFSVGRILGFAILGLPAHGLWSQAMAGAVLAAVAYVAATPLNRWVMRSIVRQDSGRR